MTVTLDAATIIVLMGVYCYLTTTISAHFIGAIYNRLTNRASCGSHIYDVLALPPDMSAAGAYENPGVSGSLRESKLISQQDSDGNVAMRRTTP